MSTPAPAASPGKIPKGKTLKVYQHSDLLYWWVVWAYGYVCALLTAMQGERANFGGHTDVLIHTNPWLGISFSLLVLFVLIFTNARARGIWSLVLILVVVLLGVAVNRFFEMKALAAKFTLLLIHMNLAFYVFFSSVLLAAWFIVIFIIDRLSYVYFAPTQVGKKQVFGEGSENFVATNVHVSRQSDDIFIHRILGLWPLFGTGDLDIRFSTGGGERHYALKNVWRIGVIEQEVNRLLRAREQVK
ncbi:MAG: hypothetical protein ACREC6_00320 [Hyphomicrobiaceae bacterium]